ncbi:T9SS type A sorting domain-containing protein [Polluticoccus soli]|uniref:T9SS type A sorting domain-containing protein n=1 Tax=Polluticoccus soli TaxID=3034150 RepID=UPI0023E1F7BD|nr:T9SS type A sorting domain-containing protein [Flavipsychrobacter sp. JY13-12]
MAKTFTLLFLVLIVALTSFAQRMRFNDTTNVWTECDWKNTVHGGAYADYSISDDTVWNGYKYYFHYRYSAWIREDTANRILYYRFQTDTADKVFVDFNMAVGDSLFFLHPVHSMKLLQVDSVPINGSFHRVLKFDRFPIMEGVGPQQLGIGPDAPFYPICCFENNGQRPTFPYPQVWFDNVTSCVTSIKEINEIKRSVVAPNPITANSRIILPRAIPGGQLVITNTTGQTISSLQIGNETSLPLPQLLPAGVYFYRITNATKEESYPGKFIVE